MANQGFIFGGQTVISNPIFVQTILPFLLVFTLVFAILQKSRLLGEGKRQIDAIVALVIGLLVISFAQAVGIILQMTVFLAVALVILLVLMILFGTFSKEDEFFKEFPKKLKWAFFAVIIIAVAIALIYVTGSWTYIYDWIFISGLDGTSIATNVLFLVIIIAAVAIVIWGAGKKSGS